MQKMSRNICFAGSLLIMAALFIGGTLMVIKSFDVGERFGSIEVRENRGIDAGTYDSIVENRTQSYQIAGGIMEFVGGIGMIAFCYKKISVG